MNQEFVNELERAVTEAEEALRSKVKFSESLPSELACRLAKWPFGKKQWISPVNVMLTAAWYKWLNPVQDVCRIWASVPRGFSIRTVDEDYTVPLVCKHRIYDGFCSRNSGMQGSRKLEGASGLGRINRGNLGPDRCTRWDQDLFSNILNDINDHPKIARTIFLSLLQIGFEKKFQRESVAATLREFVPKINNRNNEVALILRASQETRDPQFVVAVCEAVFGKICTALPKFDNCKVCGADTAATGANTQSQDVGDLWIESSSGNPIAAIEVKDITRQFDYPDIAAAEERVSAFPEIEDYYLIAVQESVWSSSISQQDLVEKLSDSMRIHGVLLTALSLRQVLAFAKLCQLEVPGEFIQCVTKSLLKTSDISMETLGAWQKLVEEYDGV